jgi:GTPase SAR1 family protein
MLEFIQILKQRYQQVISQLNNRDNQLTDYLLYVEQLIYAEAFIRKGHLLTEEKQFPLQIAVIGPTQAGKSSVVNLLAGSNVADVSPLAGHTVHPHGYCNGVTIADCDGLQNYFGRFQQLAQQQLSASRYDCYSVAELPAPSEILPISVLWDTPDFDSIDAADYKEGVIRTIALADIVILVVSKEKYADQSVWEMLQIIASFQQPTLICINKLTEGSEQIIKSSLAEKWRQLRADPVPEIVSLFYNKQTGAPAWTEQTDIFAALQKSLRPNKHPLYLQQLLNQYWAKWLEPVHAEIDAAAVWQTLVDQSLQQAEQEYRRDFLDHPHHYSTFQNALIELLNLLEIPGLAYIMGKTRRVMTWPIRKLFSLGQKSTEGMPTQEESLLNQIGEHVIIQLSDQIWSKSESDSLYNSWWKDVGTALRKNKAKILQNYAWSVDDYHQNFQQNVEETAQRLYHRLQDQPVILNTLRATRVTTDAAAMALAIQTGGIGLHDLIITPAILSITSLLAESAVGSYMNRQEAELKQHQLETVRDKLFHAELQQQLYQLVEQLPGQRRFNIAPELLQQAEQTLKEKQHGLRIL